MSRKSSKKGHNTHWTATPTFTNRKKRRLHAKLVDLNHKSEDDKPKTINLTVEITQEVLMLISIILLLIWSIMA